ncbi:MAG: cell division protein ZipA [Ahniella sp.]|nr:cell division protein ZipA [Ahniella sp.]
MFAGVLVLGLIYWQGSRQSGQQGRRIHAPRPARERQAPDLDRPQPSADPGFDAELQAELTRLSLEISEHRGQDFSDRPDSDFEPTGRREPALGAMEPSEDDDQDFTPAPSVQKVRTEPELVPLPPESQVGARTQERIDRIVTLFVCAEEGEFMRGSDIVVAAEKTGLTYGHLGIFHSLIPGKPELGPIFSVASMVKPGHFEMRKIQELRTPGLTLFMALPGPMRALDAWDSMFPIANRLGELLGAQVLDEHRNALGRQRVQHLRDELRAYDREQDKNVIKRPW